MVSNRPAIDPLAADIGGDHVLRPHASIKRSRFGCLKFVAKEVTGAASPVTPNPGI
ncbi:MAG: hypothetical protein ACE5IY_18465 [bacterium]